MSVNNMNFEQASSLLNAVHEQVTGQKAIQPTNTADFVSLATTTLKAGYDPVLNAITQMVGKTIFSSRPYNRKFRGIQMDSQRWGAITRKLQVVDKDFESGPDCLRSRPISEDPAGLFWTTKSLKRRYAAAAYKHL